MYYQGFLRHLEQPPLFSCKLPEHLCYNLRHLHKTQSVQTANMAQLIWHLITCTNNASKNNSSELCLFSETTDDINFECGQASLFRFLYNAVSDLIVFFLLSKAKGFTVKRCWCTQIWCCSCVMRRWRWHHTHILHKLQAFYHKVEYNLFQAKATFI